MKSFSICIELQSHQEIFCDLFQFLFSVIRSEVVRVTGSPRRSLRVIDIFFVSSWDLDFIPDQISVTGIYRVSQSRNFKCHMYERRMYGDCCTSCRDVLGIILSAGHCLRQDQGSFFIDLPVIIFDLSLKRM